jgi:Asp/Glu/hydantoin racemase
MKPRVVLIHTVSGLTDMFNDLCAEIGGPLAEAELWHVSDETLIRRILEVGGLTPAVWRRTVDHITAAEEAGADVVQLTCSSISPCADAAQEMVSVPVLKIDEPMLRAAVTGYASVGVIATNPGTLTPSGELVEALAAEEGREVLVESVLCEGAYDAWLCGDAAEHDRIVREHLLGLMERVEVVCLAQASMARIVEALAEGERTVPVLSSPRPAVERLAAVLEGLGN